jgi:hypothetical protein
MTRAGEAAVLRSKYASLVVTNCGVPVVSW